MAGGPDEQIVRALTTDIRYVNKQRNDVAHRGEFRTKSAAGRVLKRTYTAAVGLVRICDGYFNLDPYE